MIQLEYENGGIIILYDLNEKEMKDRRVPALFNRSRHIILSFLSFLKITMNCQNELLELMETITTF